ncbi:hypothetical protein [Bacteroides heparinolyticus]|uniref:hypothetical protein n=1 Tax=Prevotella heparinolytica TaxID=28113 RepID=UPI0035A06A47
MKTNISFLLLGGSLLLGGCYDEGTLSPSEEPEAIYGKYTLPQGDHDYDAKIADYYNNYQTLILYKFTDKDFGWSPTANVAFNLQDTVLNPGADWKYYAAPADENFVGQQLKLLEDKWFNYFSEKMKNMLPQRILLCSTIDKLTVGKGHMPTPEDCQKLEVYSGYYHIAVNWGSSSIQEMTKEQRNNFKVIVCTAFFDKIRSDIKIPETFSLQTHYTDGISSEAIHGEGLLDYAHRANLKEDWFDFIKLAISTPLPELQGEGGVLNPQVDINGKIKAKYDIMINYFIDNFDTNLQKIGDDKEI